MINSELPGVFTGHYFRMCWCV